MYIYMVILITNLPFCCVFPCTHSFIKGYCIGYGALHSPSSSVSAADDIWDSKDCVWSVAPRFLSPGWSREPLLAVAAAAPHHDYNCKGDNTEKCQCWCWRYRIHLWSVSCLRVNLKRCLGQASSPHDLVFFTALSCSVFAVVVVVH